MLISKEKRQRNEALWLAARENRVEMCLDALNYRRHGDLCAQVNSKGEEDWTALHMAASHNCLEVCEVLILTSEEIDLHAFSRSGQTALHLAAERGFLEIVQLLVKVGNQVNTQDREGRTALHLAAMMGQTDTVLWLLSQGADFSVTNLAGKTAYEEANKEVATLFELYFTEKNIPFQKCLPRADLQNPPALVAISFDRPSPADVYSYAEYTDFVPKCLIGKGGFAEVYLVEQQSTGKEFAMKVLNKEKILEHNLERYVLTERNVLSYIKHPFIVGLNYAFQTPEKLLLILDYCPGGDLGSTLRREKRFTEARARIYVCEVLLALEALHSNHIIYRDLKPDNLVLDSEGHVLLTDFGLSKEGVPRMARTESFCGSIGYLAPEMLRKEGHNQTVDYYLLGVLLYEMLVGKLPFYDFDVAIMLRKIVRTHVQIPTSVSSLAAHLLTRLLDKEPSTRLGAGPSGANEIKAHPFFEGIDWEAAYHRHLQPPPIAPVRRVKTEKLSIEKVYGITMEGTYDGKMAGWSFAQDRPHS